MGLGNGSYRHRADFGEAQPPEVRCFKYLNVPLIAKQNVRFVLQGSPINGPKATANPVAVDCLAIVWIVDAVVVHRREARQENRTAGERACPLSIAHDFLRIQRLAFHWKALLGINRLPSEI